MNSRTHYLLRTKSQIETFRRRFAKALERNAPKYQEWIRSLPNLTWIHVPCKPEHEEFVTGLICILYIDKLVNISFDETATHIRREYIPPE